MFAQTAQYYDKIYSAKDYPAEVQSLRAVIRQHCRSRGRALLDVACGTGGHLELLRNHFEAEGLDLSPEMLELARRRNPDVVFHAGDMTDFDTGRQYDVITCLFSSIGYVRTLENLNRAAACMARHLKLGGLLVVEPWFTPEAWKPGTVHALFIDEPDLKIARVNTSYADGRLSYFDLHYLIGTGEKTEHFVERHELGLFTNEEMEAAFMQAGLETIYDPNGLTGRGLWIGRKAALLAGQVVIREAAAADAQAIGDVYLAARKAFLPYAQLAHSDEEVRWWIAQSLIPKGGVFVATVKDSVVGMMALARDGQAGWIDQLYLHPDWAGLGIGTQLLMLARTELGSPIRLYTFQQNYAARRFYERHGFCPIAFSDGQGNEEKCPDVLYEWSEPTTAG